MGIEKLKFLLLSIFVVLGIVFVLPNLTIAQSASSILVNVVPPNPNPFEDVSVTLSSYTYNLDTVLISWSVGGKTSSSGVGRKTFSTKAPASGSEITIIASIGLPSGTIEQRILIRPAVMVLLAEATDSYVPPFYRGKALPTLDSEIKVVAIPEIKNSTGKIIDSRGLSYVWKKDYTINQEGSGYGKNFFIYDNDFLEGTNTIGVTAQATDGRSSAEGSISVQTVEPKVSFYRNDKALGVIWEEAISSPYKIMEDLIMVAIPYFISPKELLHPALVFNWQINDSPVTVERYKKNILPLKIPEDGTGTSKIRLDIENTNKIFQTSTKEVYIEF